MGIYPKETKSLSQRNIYISTFIAPLFTIVKTWKQLKCPPKDEWIKISIPHTLEYHSVINRRNLVICDTMDAPEGYHVEWNVRQRKTSTVWSHMKSKQTIFNNTEKRTSLVVQWLRLCPSTAGDTGSIPGRGSSTCCVVWSKTTTTTKTTETKPSQKKKK